MTRGLDALLITAALAGIQDCPTEPNSAEPQRRTESGIRFASGRSRHQCGVTPHRMRCCLGNVSGFECPKRCRSVRILEHASRDRCMMSVKKDEYGFSRATRHPCSSEASCGLV
jgi:hypothetical protein